MSALLSGENLLLLFAALLVATIFASVLLPFALKFAKSASAKIFSHNFGKSLKTIRRHPAQTIILSLLLVTMVAFAYYYYLTSQSLIVTSAVNFSREKATNLKILESKGLAGFEEAGIYLLDVRSREDYAKGHIRGSESKPADRALKEVGLGNKVDLVVYSSAENFVQAKGVAQAVERQRESTEEQYEPGKVYLIRDGYEGLKKAGLLVEVGEWD